MNTQLFVLIDLILHQFFSCHPSLFDQCINLGMFLHFDFIAVAGQSYKRFLAHAFLTTIANFRWPVVHFFANFMKLRFPYPKEPL